MIAVNGIPTNGHTLFAIKSRDERGREKKEKTKKGKEKRQKKERR
jgi:hypothetical protein